VRAMVVTELLPGRKMCYENFGRDGAGRSKCGHGGEGGRCVAGGGLTDASGVTELVVRVLRVAGVAVVWRNVSSVVLSGSSLENW
jgi:hypothetical protein